MFAGEVFDQGVFAQWGCLPRGVSVPGVYSPPPWTEFLTHAKNFNDPSLFVLGYHWLPLATIDLVGDNREFEV